MTAKFTVLGSTTLATASSTVTFASIPGGYKDLIVVIDGQTTDGANCSFTINSDTGTNYPYVFMRGDGSSAASGATSAANANYVGYFTANPSNAIIQFLDYSATDKHKSSLVRMNDPSARVYANANKWANTAAINRIDFILSGGESFATGSTFRLLGVN